MSEDRRLAWIPWQAYDNGYGIRLHPLAATNKHKKRAEDQAKTAALLKWCIKHGNAPKKETVLLDEIGWDGAYCKLVKWEVADETVEAAESRL